MFELVELTLGSFIIVKANDSAIDNFPINVHGILKVVEKGDTYVALLVKGKSSNELTKSNELENLKKKAIELTKEAIADEFSD